MSASTDAPAGYCPHCGYAIDPGRCTECGRLVRSDELESVPHPHRWWWLRTLIASIVLFGLLFFLVRFGFIGSFKYVLSGQIFTEAFTLHRGDVVDGPPPIGMVYFIFTLFNAVALVGMASARWISDRRTRTGYWAYVIPTVCICACLVIFFTIPFSWVLKYIGTMGFTERRVYGLIYGIAGYLAILAFLCWAAWPPKRRGTVRLGTRESNPVQAARPSRGVDVSST